MPDIHGEETALRREIQDLPRDVEEALEATGLMADYRARPAYQQNDYLDWFARAKQETTRRKRIDQMLEELQTGGVYMGMDHPPSRRP